MSQLPNATKQRRIDQIKLLGSHDSGAYKLDLNASTRMEKTPILNLFKDLAEVDPLIFQIVSNLTLSQPLSVFEQLEQGVRAFDFRILYNQTGGEFYLSHSYATVPLEPVLFQIRQFLLEHTGEVLVIQMEDDYEHRQQTSPFNSQAALIVEKALGSFLIPVTPNQTLENLVKLNQRVLFGYTKVKEYWPDGQTVNQSLSIIETYLPELEKAGTGFLNLVFFTVTPNTALIFKNLIEDWTGANLPDSLLDWAARMNPRAIDFIKSNLQKLDGLNLISVDAPSDAFVAEVISWNR